MLKWSVDYCDEVTIIKIYPGDQYEYPTDVIAVFRAGTKRKISKKEIQKYDTFCEYHSITYMIDEEGNMVWQ